MASSHPPAFPRSSIFVSVRCRCHHRGCAFRRFPSRGEGVGWGEVLLAEALVTCMICYVHINVRCMYLGVAHLPPEPLQ